MSLHSRFNTRRLFIATIASLVLVPAVEVLAQPEDIEVEVDVAVEEQAAPASPVAPPSTGTSSGTEAPSPAEKPVNPNSVAGILQQVDAREAELVRLGLEKQPAAPAAERKELHVLLDPAFLGVYYDGSPNRFFVARLRLVNRTAKPVEIKGRDIALLADGKTLRLEDIPAQLRGYNFLVGNKGYSLSSAEFNTPEKVAVPAGGTSDVWVVYAKLDKGTKVPAMKLRVPVAEGDVREIDVNEQALAVLKRRIERIGPRQALAIVRIGGEINTINVQDLVHGFDELAAEKVARAVITWDEKAPPVDSNVWSWLYQSVLQAGMAEVQNQQFPTISASIRELHLAALPERNASSRSSGDGPSRVHKTLLEAASAAMKSAFETLPREELLDEIRQGHPLIRAAALEGGGGRLSDEHLPILVAHANGNEQPLAQAAIHALRHFSHPRAIETLKTHAAGGPVRPRPMTLKELARRGAKIETSQAAQESLAASRFAAAHEALMDVLREADAERKRSIVQVLARHPRPMWSETIYRFVKDPDSGINVEALKALVTVGHPELFPLLKEALQSGRPELEAAAFATLAGRTDPESEELAMAYALEHLEKQPPTSEIQSLLHRTKDPRAMPLLLKHLRQVGSGRSSVIGLLARIGDETTAEILVDMYPSLSGSDKRAALQALMQLRAPVFRQLAGQALLSDDSSLISTASQGLSADASDEAERLLIEAFDKSSNSRAWMYLSNSLSQIATPESRAVLVKARDSNNAQKQQYAMNALRNMRSRSPGYQMLYQARHFEQQQKWGEAVERYDAAIKLDPDLPDAYAGRAEAFLKLDKLDQAEKDFRKASQLDPYSGKANSGLAILLARRDKVDEALKHIEDARKKAEKDRYDQGAFAYGAARVYSRAYGALQKTMDAPERDKKLAQYRKQALDDLQAAVNKGFRDFERIKSEADFAALKDLPEFQKIHSPNAKQPNATPQADVAEPADS